VSVGQMLKFVSHYVESRKIPVGERAEQCLSAAVFCYMNGGTEAARGFMQKAIDMAPYLEDRVRRLVPLDL